MNLNTVPKTEVPAVMSKGSAQYAGVKTKIDNCDFDNDAVKVTCDTAEEATKTLNSVKTYLTKKGLKEQGIWASKDSLTIWVQKKA